jgi:hypothetical protein
MQRDGNSFEDAEANFPSIRQPSRRFVKDANVAGLIAFLVRSIQQHQQRCVTDRRRPAAGH